MGFEVTFFYHERQESGQYNTEEKKELKKKVGSPYEEVSLDKLANTILLQLARRDIWVIDVEIYEYTKTKISFKESKNGVLIKNRKFCLNGETSLVIEEETPPPPPQHYAQQPKRVLKRVVLDPEASTLRNIKIKGLQLSPDKEYAVYNIRPSTMLGLEIYTIFDNNNRQIDVSSEYFVNKEIKYYRDDSKDSFGSIVSEGAPRLAFDGEYIDDVVDIRKK